MNADKLAKALDELPAAYDLLPLFMLPGSRPDMGSLQHHSADNTRAPLVLAVLDQLEKITNSTSSPELDAWESYQRWLAGYVSLMENSGILGSSMLPHKTNPPLKVNA